MLPYVLCLVFDPTLVIVWPLLDAHFHFLILIDMPRFQINTRRSSLLSTGLRTVFLEGNSTPLNL